MVTTWPDTRDVEESELLLGEESGGGGQGQVLRVLGRSPGLVYKRYRVPGAHPDALKLLVDIPSSMPPADRERLLRLSAWPLARVVRHGQVSGFLMQEIPSRFYAPNSVGANKLRELQYLVYERKPAWGDIVQGDVNAKIRIEVAREFANLVHLLHDRSLVIGDVSMTNVLWAPGDPPSILLIDCDGIRQLGSPPVFQQADTLDWGDPQQPASGPDLDSDRYKLALLVGRVLCKAPYLRPGDELQLVPDLPSIISLRVHELWVRAAGPRADRPHASDWITALNGGAEVPAVRSGPRRGGKATPLKVRMLDGRYQLEARLGPGAMGSVWKAYDTRLERTVAVKELVSGSGSGEDLAVRRERMRREALALAKIDHPAIVSIYDLVYAGRGRDPWIVMSYIRGRPLHSIISDSPGLDEQKVASIGLPVLHGLMACHERHVYHRDVKPANILLSDDGTVHLVDFGIAQIGGSDPLTAETKVIGTPEFLAPELFTGQPAGPLTDLWALGVTLYYALDGRSPFRAETMAGTIASILSRNPPEPRTRGEVAALVLRMLSKDPAERPDAATVAAVLQRIARGGQTGPSHMSHTRAAATRQDLETGQRQQHSADLQRTRPPLMLTPLTGMPTVDAAKMVSDWPADHAAADLLKLGETQAAQIINQCDDPVAGKLLSAIAIEQPAQGRKILEMLTTERAGRLLDHMSSIASAPVLSLPPLTGALHVLAHAADPTVVAILLKMNASSAAALVKAMDTERTVRLLAQAPPAAAANLLRSLPPVRRQDLMSRLPQEFCSLVAHHL